MDQAAEYGTQLAVIQLLREMIRLFPIHWFIIGSIALGRGAELIDRKAPTAPPDIGKGQLPVVFQPAVAAIVAAGIEQEKLPALLEGHKPVAAAQVP